MVRSFLIKGFILAVAIFSLLGVLHSSICGKKGRHVKYYPYYVKLHSNQDYANAKYNIKIKTNLHLIDFLVPLAVLCCTLSG